MFALPKPSIKFDVLDIVLTLVFVVIKLKKYIFSRSIVCVVAQSACKTREIPISGIRAKS